MHEYKANLQQGPYKHALHPELPLETGTPMIVVRRDATDLTQLNNFQQFYKMGLQDIEEAFWKASHTDGVAPLFLV